MNIGQPFSVVGVDFVGPLFIKTSGVTSKAWICLYGCAIVRAVRDLNTTTFLSSFRRFSSRRELPHLIISDNGQTFKAAATIIRRMFASAEVKKHFHNQQVKWTFNLERAPWWGGFFERMVKSVKRCLKKTLSNSSLSNDELLTALIEFEMVLNSRPLSFVSSNDGHRLLSLPSCTVS